MSELFHHPIIESEKQRLRITAARTGRLSSFLLGELKMSTGLMNKLKWGDGIRVNGIPQHTNYPVQPGDVITVALEEETPEYPAEDGPLTILYEDDWLLALLLLLACVAWLPELEELASDEELSLDCFFIVFLDDHFLLELFSEDCFLLLYLFVFSEDCWLLLHPATSNSALAADNTVKNFLDFIYLSLYTFTQKHSPMLYVIGLCQNKFRFLASKV